MQLPHLLQCRSLYSHTQSTIRQSDIHTSICTAHHSSSGVSAVSCVASTGTMQLSHLLQCWCLCSRTFTIIFTFHNLTSNTPLTPQVQVCKMCHVWQALTQCCCPSCSNLVVCTHTQSQSRNHIIKHKIHHSLLKFRSVSCVMRDKYWLNTVAPFGPILLSVLTHTITIHNPQSTIIIKCTTRHSSSGVWAVSFVASTDAMPLLHRFQCRSLYSHTIYNHTIHNPHIKCTTHNSSSGL